MLQPISEEYRAEQQKLHASQTYGVASSKYVDLVRTLLDVGKCSSLSDYGAGKRNLERVLGDSGVSTNYLPYDPAFPEYGEPQPADLVACIDVLEHIEPDLLDKCLKEIASIARRLVLLTVHTGPAKKVLSDGRNAHLIQKPRAWWLPKLEEHFDIIHFQSARKGFFVLGCPKGAYCDLDAQLDLRELVRAARAVAPARASLLKTTMLSVRRLIQSTKYEAGTLWLAARHPETPWYVKLLAGVSSVLALSPFDLTPDFVPVVGYFDDIALLLLSSLIVKRLMPPMLRDELRRRAATVDYAQAMRGSAAVCSVWLGATTIAIAHVWRPLF